MITLQQYWMGRDILYRLDLTQQIRDNAEELLRRVNGLLSELGVENVRVSSGWRPKQVNAATQGASKTSYHIVGKAVDIEDLGHRLYDKLMQNPALLDKYGLWAEDKSATETWLHLDVGTRSARHPRVFKP